MRQHEGMQATLNIVTHFWPQMSGPLTPPQTTEEFHRLVEFSHLRIDSRAGDETNKLATLLELAGILITNHEREHRLLWEKQYQDSSQTH